LRPSRTLRTGSAGRTRRTYTADGACITPRADRSWLSRHRRHASHARDTLTRIAGRREQGPRTQRPKEQHDKESTRSREDREIDHTSGGVQS